MDRDQLQRICEELGLGISVNEKGIEEKHGYYENYNLLEHDGQRWLYSEMNFESRPQPEKEETKEFIQEEEAIKYFFLKTLKKHYFNKIHIPNNPIRNIHDVEGLEKYFQTLGIADDCYSFHVLRPQEVFVEIEAGKVRVSYIDEKRQKKFTTMPLELDRGLFAIYRLTYSLHLLKALEREFIERNILTEQFNDDDISLFIK